MSHIEDIRQATSSQLAALELRKKLRGAATRGVYAPPVAPAQPDIVPKASHVRVKHKIEHDRATAELISIVISNVCGEYYHLKSAVISGPIRTYQANRARQAAYWLARDITGWSLPLVGRLYGNRDHKTILHGLRKVEHHVSIEPEYANVIRKLRARIIERLQQDHPQIAISDISECRLLEQQREGAGANTQS